jgi:hypothetical protein
LTRGLEEIGGEAIATNERKEKVGLEGSRGLRSLTQFKSSTVRKKGMQTTLSYRRVAEMKPSPNFDASPPPEGRKKTKSQAGMSSGGR